MVDLSVVNRALAYQMGEDGVEDDAFKRLPDGLILSHIFDKVTEAKSLCFCSTVSKRFSSLVYQSKTVTIKIPLQIPLHQPYPTNRRTPAKYVSNLTTKFLVKFKSLKSLHVEFDCSAAGTGGGNCESCSSCSMTPIVKWKIDLGSASMIMFFARRIADDKDDGGQIINDEIGADSLSLIRDCFLNHLKDASFMFSLMRTLVRLLPESLQNVVLTDSKKQGGFVSLGGSDDGQLVDVKMLKEFNVRNFLGGKGAVRYWDKKLLQLPVSGCVMRRVFVIRYKEKWVGNEDDHVLAAKAAFQREEEKVYSEAAKELLTEKNCSNGFMWVGYF